MVLTLKLIKYAGIDIRWRFLNFINICWLKCYVTKEWNRTKVILLIKNGNKMNNYQVTRLLNTAYLEEEEEEEANLYYMNYAVWYLKLDSISLLFQCTTIHSHIV